MKKVAQYFLYTLFIGTTFAQQPDFNFNKSIINSVSGIRIQASIITIDWKPVLQNLEMPAPGGKSYRSFLLRQKETLTQYHRGTKKTTGTVTLGNADNPIMLRNFKGNKFDGSVPNDNDLAISNDNKLISVINSTINFYDIQQDTLLLSISLEAFFDTLGLTAHMYDPKVIYDPKLDRFILICLSGNVDSTSNIVVGFSETADPMGFWNMYAIPGDPLDNDTWSDYPIVAITDDELFITVNALHNDTVNTSDSWKYLFTESVIWQVNKSSGYNGDSLIIAYYNNIEFGGKPIRNLCPIQGGSTTYGPNMFLLSNRNFAVTNDTFFVLEITGLLSDAQTTLQINYSLADVSYGLAPDGKQSFNRKLQTNDSRVLGGYLEDNKIHFVQNSVHPDTLRAAIYHGILTNLNSTKDISGAIIGQDHLDFGYPNISYTGKYPGDDEAIISFNYTSVDSFAGFSTVFYNSVSGYSERVTLKTGEDFVNIIPGANQRWGDYSGSQRKYNEPGKVWVAGFYGERIFVDRINSTWIAEIVSPDTSSAVSAPAIESKTYATNLFPNPTHDIFSLEFELAEAAFLDISLFDLTGRLIKTFNKDLVKTGKNRFSFSLNPLQPGTYLLIVKGKEDIITSEKIIKH